MKKYGIKAANVPSYSPGSVSEHAMTLLLMLLRRMKRNQKMVRDCNYKVDGIRGRELRSMTAGVFGSGKIGALTIQALAGFGCQVLVCDPFEKEEIKEIAEYVTRETLLKNSDVILIHCPLDENNYHLISEKSLQQCKDGVVIVNTARGGLVDAEAVLHGIETGKISGFAFDVYEGEDSIVRNDFEGAYPPDPVFEKLCEKDNVIYTAHISFYTDEAVEALVRISTENIEEFFKTGRCKNEIE